MKPPCEWCPFGDNPMRRDHYTFSIRRAVVFGLVRWTAAVSLVGLVAFVALGSKFV